MKKENVKRIFGMLMALVLTIGLFWPAAEAKAAAVTSPLMFLDGGYNDTRQIYVVNVALPDRSVLDTINTVSGKVLVNGVETSVYFEGYNSPTYYQILIPYSAVWHSGQTTHGSKQSSCYITIPAGTVMGNITVAEDFHVKLYTGTMSSANCLIEPVSEVPDYFFGSWNYSGTTLYIQFRNTLGIAAEGWLAEHDTVYVDEKAVSVRWEGDGSYYYFPIPYSEFDGTSLSTFSNKILRIPACTVGKMTLSEDVYIKINNNDRELLTNTSVTLGPTSGYQDDQGRYIIRLVPSDGRVILDNPGPSSASLIIDGVEVSDAISMWDPSSNNYGACIPYEKIQAGATGSTQIGMHSITFPAGTYVGNMRLEKDVHVTINGRQITMSDVPMGEMEVTGGGAQNNGNYRYIQWIKPKDGSAVGARPTGRIDIYVDGHKVQNGAYFADSNATDGYALALDYQYIQGGAQYSNQVGLHTVRIPAGTRINDIALSKDLYFRVHGDNVWWIDAPITVSVSDKGGNNDNQWYVIWLKPSDGRTTTDLGNTSKLVYIDGKAVTSGISWVKGSSSYGLCIKYSSIDSSVTGAGSMGTHYITIPKGTYVGDITTANPIYIQISGWNMTEVTPTTVNMGCDTIVGAENMSGLYLNATSDPLPNSNGSTYYAFETGGLYCNGVLQEGALLEKLYNPYYYLHSWYFDLTKCNAGDIITIDGTVFASGNYVSYNPISFIRNADGSFSLYDENAESVPAKEVIVKDLYINMDVDGSYSVPSIPLVPNGKMEVKINGELSTDYTLSQGGVYYVERTVGNALFTKTVGKELGDITYKQTVYMFETGDANLDGRAGAADIVYYKRNLGKSVNLREGANDVNKDGMLNETDYALLLDLLLDKKAPSEVLGAEDEVLIGAISDLHYLANGRDAQIRVNTRKALSYYKSQNVDVIMFNGDISDLGEVGSYQKLVADIVSVYPDAASRPKMIFTGDNHEWYDAWTVNGHTPTASFAETQSRFCRELSSLRDGSTDKNTCFEVNGYHFIGVSSDGMNGGYATYTDATINWVNSQLQTAAAADPTGKQPIFLALHQAPPNTVNTSTNADHYDSTKMDALLKQYPQLVVVTSHTHAPLQDEKSIHQGNFTTLNTASLAYAGGVSASNTLNDSLMSLKNHYAQGLLISAKGNAVSVERCDFWNDEIIKTDWTFETSNSASSYTKYTDARANSRVAPSFPSGTSVSASWKDSTTAKVTFKAATHNDHVRHYTVKVYQGNTLKSTLTYSSLFFMGMNNMTDTMEIEVTGLSSSNAYRFDIQAVESWGKTSSTISGSLSKK